MPAVKLIVSKHHALFTSSIALNGEIISLYSYYTKKGLVCVTIADPFSHQPSSYSECTKLNTYASCDMRSVSLNKYIFLTRLSSC